MKFQRKDEGGATLVKLAGHFSELNRDYEELQDHFVSLSSASMPIVGVDMSGVEFIDSSSIGLLVLFHKACEERKKGIILFALSENVRMVFEITNLMNVFNVMESEADFLAAAATGLVRDRVSFVNVNVASLIDEVEAMITDEVGTAGASPEPRPGLDDSEIEKLLKQLGS